MNKKLVELREAAGLTQEALANIVGIPVSLIREYESGEKTAEDLSLNKTINYAHTLGVEPRGFLDVLMGMEKKELTKELPAKIVVINDLTLYYTQKRSVNSRSVFLCLTIVR